MLKPNRKLTLSEVNACIPRLESLFVMIDEKRKNVDRLHDHFFMEELIQEAVPEKPAENLEQNAQDVDASVTELKKPIEQIHAMGGVIRNLDKGWVDFLSEHAGQVIYLCWRRGEVEIKYYGAPSEASDERKPLP